ncbi:hypothetical protein F4778DRAFT_491643 [Xylariomycetidae sp. FL2044]|nr:hypothetical protein F4778DRAFT_491643 [Xylariomycetidae sp. FL2044]
MLWLNLRSKMWFVIYVAHHRCGLWSVFFFTSPSEVQVRKFRVKIVQSAQVQINPSCPRGGAPQKPSTRGGNADTLDCGDRAVVGRTVWNPASTHHTTLGAWLLRC